MANMVNINAKFAQLFSPPVFWSANVSFTIFAIYLLLSIYKSATYMQGAANLCKSIFFPPVKDAYSARMFLCRTVCHMNLVLVSSAPKSLGGGGGGGPKIKKGPPPPPRAPPLDSSLSLLQLDGRASGLLTRRSQVRLLFEVVGFFLPFRLCHSLQASCPGRSGGRCEIVG